MGKLSDQVDWQYLLREFWLLYRFGSAGGNPTIRSHLKEVRNKLNAELEKNPTVAFDQPNHLPVCAWFNRAIDQGLNERTAPLARALMRVQEQLTWRYGYERMRPGLARKYAYAELLGPNGPVISENLILGVVLFAPKCTYPEHSHDGISESYICISGSISDSNYSVFSPGSLLFNPPKRAHRMTTGDFEPTLLAYAWTGKPEKLANQKMDFSVKK
ncbi:dimethylsulfonioproprionate lyase family protein [Marinobacter adhaerens]|uniref:dimethylsulfonioproprionate lyase family protein n=1 Tax=Marinobacter adhaerens TaxID=1033846 RepID=UPI003F6E5CBA